MTLQPIRSALLLGGWVTNRYSFPVYLSHCFCECEDNQGHVTNNANAMRPIPQWIGVTNYRAPVRPTGPYNPSLYDEALLPGGVAKTFIKIPENTRRARFDIVYLRRAGSVGTSAAKILPLNSLLRWPKTLRWLSRHGMTGYFTEEYEGEWISNQPMQPTPR